MGVGCLIVALRDAAGNKGCPAAERGLLERRVRGGSSTCCGSGSRVRWAGAALMEPARLVCVGATAATGAGSSPRRERLKRRSIAVLTDYMFVACAVSTYGKFIYIFIVYTCY